MNCADRDLTGDHGEHVDLPDLQSEAHELTQPTGLATVCVMPPLEQDTTAPFSARG